MTQEAGPAHRIGIDLGGTKIEGVAIDAAGRELARRRVPTPSGDYAAVVGALAGLVRDLEREAGARCAVGIGHPGALSPATGRMKNSNSLCLNGRPLDRDLEEALARPVRMANDANCLALSEAVDGAGAGVEVVFGVILGTGVGGGIVVRGKTLVGPNALAGEWGHNPLPWPDAAERDGPRCWCGRSGCIETFLSGPGMTRDHATRAGQDLAAEEIAVRAERGEAAAAATLQIYEDRLARALAGVINLLDPDVIVMGGGVSGIARLYRNVPRRWGRYVFSDRVDTPLVPAKHGDASGVRGAAWLWPASAAGPTDA